MSPDASVASGSGAKGYVVDLFRPDDAPGMSALFSAVYGSNYPLSTASSPEHIVEQHRQGRLYPVVARCPDGSIAGQMALFRTSAPYAGLWECGQGMVHPDWRRSFVLFHLFTHLIDVLPPRLNLDVIYGEAVCSHTVMQQIINVLNFRETGLALDLLPGDGAGRVACLLVSLKFRDRAHRLYAPLPYRTLLADIAAGAGLDRELADEAPSSLATSPTHMHGELFHSAGVLRLTLLHPGADLSACLARAEADAGSRGCALVQAFLNLGDPYCPAATAVFRESGFVFGGLVPRWFDTDGLLLQKPSGTAASASVALHSASAKALLATIRREREG